MSAETLRKAAELMRERAEAAEVGPWHFDPEATWGTVRCAPRPGDDETRAIADALLDRDAKHIASWHPAVALAVADWLDRVAGDADDGIFDQHEDAMPIARAYLGEVQP